MTLGQRIQEHRLRLGLSQAGLGEKLGVSRQAVSRWEADGAVLDTDKLIALSKLFGLTLNELLQVENPPEQMPAPVEEPAEKRRPVPVETPPAGGGVLPGRAGRGPGSGHRRPAGAAGSEGMDYRVELTRSPVRL